MPRLRAVKILHAAACLLALGVPSYWSLSVAQAQLPVQPARPDHNAPTIIPAHADYIRVPLSWDYQFGGHQYIEAKIDTTSINLLLDSGLNTDLLLDPSVGEISGVHATKIRHVTGTGYGTTDGKWSLVDQVTSGSATLDSLEAMIMIPPASLAKGILGVKALSDRGAIVDYDRDTLYLLAPRAELIPIPSAAVAARKRNLHAVLKAAGQYRTFLTLLQEAGLMPLLEGASHSNVISDSLAWTDFRLRAIQYDGMDTMPAGRERVLAVRKSLNQRLRRVGQLTVFAPTDAAFAQLPAYTLRALRTEKARLAQMLQAHLLTDTYLDTSTLRLLVRGVAQPTGAAFAFHSMGPRIDVDRLTGRENGTIAARATITQPDLLAANGVAQGIGRVLMEASEATPLTAELVNRGYRAIPLQKLPNGYYVVRALVNGTPVVLALDTGAPADVVLDSRVAQSLNLPEDAVSLMLDSATTVPASITPLDLSAVNQKMAWYDISPIDGLLGSQLFVKYHARLDFATGTLYLRVPTASPTDSMPSSP